MDLSTKSSKTKRAVVKIISQGVKSYAGSGFLVSEDGVVVTNEHVLSNSRDVWARFEDGSIKKCSIISQDQSHDFALLKLEGGRYPTLDLGSYQDVPEGGEIFFCGYPLRSDHYTIHHGIVSAKFDLRGVDVFQVDGSVNSGNSGGPLIDMAGKVVGIITEKEGGIDQSLVDLKETLLEIPSVMKINIPSRGISVDPTKLSAKLIEIIHDYTNVGIGYAFSIEYAKAALQQLRSVS